jgi:putative aldouronate transport system substrate-binding protein
MKSNRKILTCALICLLISLILAACAPAVTTTAPTTTKATTATTGTTAPTTTEAPKPVIPFEKTFEFSILQGIHPPATETNRVQDLIQERTNTKITYTMVPSAGFMDKASALLASSTLPDMVYFMWQSVVPAAWIDQGAVIALNDLLDEHAPNIKDIYDQDHILPYIRHADGNIYSVNNYISFPYSTSVMIRQDWLTKLSLKAPNTVAEWVDVLKSFRDNDPNGTGQNDTIPWIGTNNQWFFAYGITGLYVPAGDNLVLRYKHPNYQAALANLTMLYQEKLIDPEYITRRGNNTANDELLVTSKAGAVERTGNEATRLTNMLRETVPAGVLGFIEPIQGPGGRWIQGRAPIGTAGAITIQAKEPEKLIQYLNWLWSEEGILLTNFGEEGVHHKIVDGKPVLLSPYDAGYDEARKAGMVANWTPLYWSGVSFITRAMSGKTESTMSEVERLAFDCYTRNVDFAFYALPGAITATASAKAYQTDVLEPLADMEEQVIMGKATYADLMAMVTKLDKELQQILSEVNAAYKAAMSN